MIGALVALALLPSLPNPFGPFPGKAGGRDATQTYQLPGWRLAERRDSFTGLAACRLSARDVNYAHGVVTFSLGHRVDTANALFRIDGGDVRSAGSVAPEAAGLGAPLLSRNTYNPTDGRVHIPASQLKGAQAVAIRANAKSNTRSFALHGLDEALAAARTRGCSDIVWARAHPSHRRRAAEAPHRGS